MLQTIIEMLKMYKYNCSSDEKLFGDDAVRIAICDDDGACRERLRKVVISCEALPNNAEIEGFSNGEALVSSHAANPFDIVFLDIQMDGMSGLETGQTIRSADRNVIIIFLTSYQQFVFQTFKIEAFDYIVKPADAPTIIDVLNRALNKYRAQHYIIQFKSQDGRNNALDVSEIILFESHNRTIKIITKDAYYYSSGSLNKYEHLLIPYGFLRCHQTYLVNMSYIKSIENTEIVTVFNHKVNMSVRKKQACIRAFNAYIVKYRV